jgi:hypothetical protein
MQMKLFRSLVSLIAVAGFVGVPAFAQNPAVFGGVANAYSFAYGLNSLVPPLQIDSTLVTNGAGVATFTVAFGTVATSDGTLITPLSTAAPVTVGTGANAETVTPSAVSCRTPQVYQSCSFTATFAYPHGTGDRVTSGTYGIAEAQIYVTNKWGYGLVAISPQLLNMAGIASGHTASNAFIVAIKSASATATVLDWGGGVGALSYTAAVGSVLASTTHVIY